MSDAPTFPVDSLPCPECGNKTLFGFMYRNEAGAHMHTHYVCTFWGSMHGANPGRCGWMGWSVPGWDAQELDSTSESCYALRMATDDDKTPECVLCGDTGRMGTNLPWTRGSGYQCDCMPGWGIKERVPVTQEMLDARLARKDTRWPGSMK